MNARLARALVVAAVLTVLAGALHWTGALAAATTPAAASEGLSRRDMLLGVLTLGVLCLAAFGFDLRDWI